jgi:hypothetical protein
MYNDTVLKREGMRILAEQLGMVEAERFIVLMAREPFNYTEWQRGLYGDMPLDEFLKKATEYRATMAVRQPG